MKIKVKIVSGAEITTSQTTPVPIPESVSFHQEFAGGSISLVSAPNAEVNVQVKRTTTLINEVGETATFNTRANYSQNPDTGRHEVSIQNRLSEKAALRGNYNGNVKAVVEYL